MCDSGGEYPGFTSQHRDIGLNTQMSYWFLASEDYGKVAIGKQGLASKSVAMYTDLSGTQLIANYVLFDGPGFFLRQHGELLKLRWGDIRYCYSQARPWGGAASATNGQASARPSSTANTPKTRSGLRR